MKNKKKCILCEKEKFIPTDFSSPSKAELWIDTYNKTLIIEASKNVSYVCPVSFCPLCGRNIELLHK